MCFFKAVLVQTIFLLFFMLYTYTVHICMFDIFHTVLYKKNKNMVLISLSLLNREGKALKAPWTILCMQKTLRIWSRQSWVLRAEFTIQNISFPYSLPKFYGGDFSMKIHNVTSIFDGYCQFFLSSCQKLCCSKYLSGWRTDQPVVLKWPCSFLLANSLKNSTLLTLFFPWGEGVLSEFSPLQFVSWASHPTWPCFSR